MTIITNAACTDDANANIDPRDHLSVYNDTQTGDGKHKVQRWFTLCLEAGCEIWPRIPQGSLNYKRRRNSVRQGNTGTTAQIRGRRPPEQTLPSLISSLYSSASNDSSVTALQPPNSSHTLESDCNRIISKIISTSLDHYYWLSAGMPRACRPQQEIQGNAKCEGLQV